MQIVSCFSGSDEALFGRDGPNLGLCSNSDGCCVAIEILSGEYLHQACSGEWLISSQRPGKAAREAGTQARGTGVVPGPSDRKDR